MPVTQDIRNAIDRGDKAAAQLLYDEVLSKRGGLGLSGHDQQILSREIARMEDKGSVPETTPEPEPAPKPRARSKSRVFKTDAEGDLVPVDD